MFLSTFLRKGFDVSRGSVSQSGRREYDLANTRAFPHQDNIILHLNGLDKNDLVVTVLTREAAARLVEQLTAALSEQGV